MKTSSKMFKDFLAIAKTNGLTTIALAELSGIPYPTVWSITTKHQRHVTSITAERIQAFVSKYKAGGIPAPVKAVKTVKAAKTVKAVKAVEPANAELFKLVELIQDALTYPDISEFDRALLAYNRATAVVDKARALIKEVI